MVNATARGGRAALAAGLGVALRTVAAVCDSIAAGVLSWTLARNAG